MKCARCGKEEMMPYKCSYCEESFCAAHRLPESHECQAVASGKKIEKRRSTEKAPRKAGTFSYNNEDDFID